MILRLDKRVEEWVRAGLITGDQAERILELEEQPSRPWVLYGVAGIGVVTVLTGIVSLVAANWETIPAMVKLGSYLVAHLLTGLVLLKVWDRNDWIRESVLTFFALFFLVGIGLTGQVFHLQSDGWQGLLFWLCLALPVVLHSRSWLPNHLWIGGFAVTAVVWMSSDQTWITDSSMRRMVFWSLPLWIGAIGFWGYQVPGLSSHFRIAAVIWSLVVVLPIATPYGNSLWSTWRSFLPAEQRGYLWIPWIALIVAAAGSAARSQIPAAARLSTAGMLVLLGVYLTVPTIWGDPTASMQAVPYQVMGCVGFLLIWALGATSAAILEYRRLFDLATFVIALRLVTVYFEIFGDLVRTGVGLILSGTVLLGMTYLWWKFRRPLQLWVEGLR